MPPNAVDDPIDQIFQPNEGLFRRLKVEAIIGDQLDPNKIEIPAYSVLRQTRLPLDYVERLAPDVGIAKTEPRQLPEPVTSPDGGVWTLLPIHCPENGELAHSELRLHKDGIYKSNQKPGNEQKKRWRNLIAAAFVIIRLPRSIE